MAIEEEQTVSEAGQPAVEGTAQDTENAAVDFNDLQTLLNQNLNKAGVPQETGDAEDDFRTATGLMDKKDNMGRWLLERLGRRGYAPANDLLSLLVGSENGDVSALIQLGGIYERGTPLKQNFQEAARCYVAALRKDEQAARPAIAHLLETHRVELYSILREYRELRAIDAELAIEHQKKKHTKIEELKPDYVSMEAEIKEREAAFNQQADATYLRRAGADAHRTQELDLKLRQSQQARERKAMAKETLSEKVAQEQRRRLEEKQQKELREKQEREEIVRQAYLEVEQISKLALQSHDVVTMQMLADLFRNGDENIKADPRRCIFWQDCIKIEQGDPDMMRKLGHLYRSGSNGFPKDLERAFAYYMKADDHYHMEAVLRDLYLSGEIDRCKALVDEYFHAYTDHQIRGMIANSVEYGYYCPPDREMAYNFHLENGDQEKAEGVAFRLSQDLRAEGKQEESLEWLRKSGEQKNNMQSQMAAIATLYETGTGGKPLDLEYAYELYQNADRNGDATRVARTLASAYRNGTDGKPVDAEKADYWQQRADAIRYYDSFE